MDTIRFVWRPGDGDLTDAYRVRLRVFCDGQAYRGLEPESSGLRSLEETGITDEQVITDIALVPIGGMFTMNAKQAAEYINTIHPQAAIPIHYGKIAGRRSDEDVFAAAVEDSIQVSIQMKRYS